MRAPSREDCIAVARQLWGAETSRSRGEMRWGEHGSRRLNLADLVWSDYEADTRGGWRALFEMAGVPLSRDEPGETAYDYRDASGHLLFQVVRKAGHKFHQRRPDGQDWTYNLQGVERVLYRLPELLAAHADELIFVVEGEKDADNLAALGLVVTTNPGGAGKWSPAYTPLLAGRQVVLLPDNDEAGRNHMLDVALALHPVAASIVVLELAGLGPKEDVSNWLARGGTADALYRLADEAALWNPVPEKPPPALPQATPAAWRGRCQTTDKGTLIPNLHNAFTALKGDPAFEGKLSYDEMRRSVMVGREPLDNTLLYAIHYWLQQAGLLRLGSEPVREAVELLASENQTHPLRDWLSRLAWDGTPRLDSWLSRCLGAEPSPYCQTVGPMFLIAMVARVFNPGCRADYMLVLEGPQGILKSQSCRVLAGEYFSDTLPDLGSDDVRTSMHLRGKWLIEISDLSAFHQAEAVRLKAFLTTTHERYTPKFGRIEVTEPRQCVFIGTTNDKEYLRDATGGRRFWPLPCGTVDVDALADEREQLFAEAVRAYRNGQPWWPDREFEETVIRPIQESRYEGDIWEDPIRDYLDDQLRYGREFALIDLAKNALGFSTDRVDTRPTRRITAILHQEGWEEYSNGRARRWRKK